MAEQKQNGETRFLMTSPSGARVWVEEKNLPNWMETQEKLKAGDPETLAKLEEQKSFNSKKIEEIRKKYGV